MEVKRVHDTMGEVIIPEGAYYGAQTARSLEHFPPVRGIMPLPVVYAIATIKKAAAEVNAQKGLLSAEKARSIAKVVDEIHDGRFDDQFPLSIWQTGSGTQTNMNVNEVIANRGNELSGQTLLHPNDDVNRSQSSNDVFPSAIHLATLLALREEFVPEADALVASLDAFIAREGETLKTGRTHLQDATPITVGQEASAWRTAIDEGKRRIVEASRELEALPIGGTAVGTGLNAPEGFDGDICAVLSRETGLSLRPLENKFYGLSMKSPVLRVHGTLKAFAADLNKIVQDVRFLSCGPRCGIGEYRIPANEPGSSIMPGKVNPTQVEAASMIAFQVMANDFAVTLAATSGQLQLNTYMPLLIRNVLESIALLALALNGLRRFLFDGMAVNAVRMGALLDRSLMRVTALSPVIGYEAAAEIAHRADENDTTLREEALKSGRLSAEELDDLLDPRRMIGR